MQQEKVGKILRRVDVGCRGRTFTGDGNARMSGQQGLLCKFRHSLSTRTGRDWQTSGNERSIFCFFERHKVIKAVSVQTQQVPP